MISAADVASWGKFATPTGTELELLERVIAAVTDHVETYYVTTVVPSDAVAQAIIMQSYRLWRRRGTPEGVASFDDFGPVRVSSLDADVRMLLMPVWGFA